MNIGLIPGQSTVIHVDTAFDQIHRLFSTDEQLNGVIVEDGRMPVAVLSRPTWMLIRDLYDDVRKSQFRLHALIEAGVIGPTQVFDARDSLETAVEKCWDRKTPVDSQYVVVIGPGQSKSLVNFHDLFRAYLNELKQKVATVGSSIAEQMESSQNSFVANMSHEIRTPLTAILGFAENILEDDISQNEMKTAAETIVRNGQHLLSLLNDVLDFAKYEAGKLNVEKIPFSVPLLLHDVIASMKSKAMTRKLDLRFKQQGALPESVISDPTRIRQILINLIGNAIKFTDKGYVEIRAQFVPSEDQQSSGRLILRVEDTGIGLKREQMHKLFAPFAQADQTTTRKFGGTGLGLTICRRLTKLLGGEMTVKSVFGKGSIFSTKIDVELPEGTKFVDDISSHASTRKRKTFDYNAAQTPCRIFLAEDSPDNQILIQRFLKKCGIDVTLGVNGQIAYEQVTKAENIGEPYDLVLMDMQMPLVDGYESTARLRKAGITTPIIALTASVLERDRQRCLEVGCDALATKPIDRGRLIKLIRSSIPKEILERRQRELDEYAGDTNTMESETQESSARHTAPVAGNSAFNPSPFFQLAETSEEPLEDSGNSGFTENFATGVFQAPTVILVDRKVALEQTGGDSDLLDTILGLILEHCPQYVEELASCIANRDTAATKRLAHTIKNSAENVGGVRISDVAKQLETSATQEIWDQVEMEFEELKQLMDRFLVAVLEMKATNVDS